MGAPRLEAVEVLWENPPGKDQGATIVRRVGGHRYERRVGPGEDVTQLEAARLLSVTRMTVNRWVRLGILKDRKRGGKSVLPFTAVRRLARERGTLATAGDFLTG